jgi:hypothetical protein
VRPVDGGRCLRPLNVKELDDPCPVLAACLPRPQVDVKEYLSPALYLPFQLGLKGVPLAQEEAIDFLLGGFGTRRRGRLAWYLTYLAARMLPCLWPLYFVHAHEERLLA